MESFSVGNRRELFIDRFLLDRMDGAALQMHTPRDEGPVLAFDKPWEGPFCGYVTALKDGDRYLLYYRGKPEAGNDGVGEFYCLAESGDGVHWERPSLGRVEFRGSRDNNIVSREPAVTHNFSPFIDLRPGVPPVERFKALAGTHPRGLFGFASVDGVTWKKVSESPLITSEAFAFDSQNVCHWAEAEGCYVAYVRTWSGAPTELAIPASSHPPAASAASGVIPANGWRAIGRSTSTDFHHWTPIAPMRFDPPQEEHLYVNQTTPYPRAPHIHLSLAARFMEGRRAVSEAQAERLGVMREAYARDCSDVLLMSTRGDGVYQRIFMESFIRPGLGPQHWTSRTNYPALGIVQTAASEISLYLNCAYAQPGAHLRRYSLRLDGFASLHAGYGGGEAVTKAFTYVGSALRVNYATSAAGGLRFELQDTEGRTLPGFTLADCQELFGNELNQEVRWAGGGLGALAGKPVRMRIALKDADLYSFRFS